jgi:hypothetical protein
MTASSELNFAALKKNVKEELYPKYGIRAVVVKGFITSHTKMAGYANMKTGGELTSFCLEDKNNDGPISLAVQYLEAGFGVVGGENAKWDLESFLQYIYRFREPGALETREGIEEEITTLSLPLDEGEYKNKDKGRGWLSLAIALRNISTRYTKELPKFASSTLYTEENQIVAGLHAEDWQFLNTLVRYYRSGFKSQNETREKNGKDRGRHKAAAQAVYYLTDGDLTGPVDTAAQELSNDVDKLEQFEMLDVEEDGDIFEELMDPKRESELMSPENMITGAFALENLLVDRERNPAQIAHGRFLESEAVRFSFQLRAG